MLTLYYSPGTCSLSPHIALFEAGLEFDAVKVDLKTKQTATDENYSKLNPNGYVPSLVIDGGEVLTEGPAIIQYIADRVPEKKLAPAPASHERYQLYSWLNFITAELHKSIGVLFSPAPEDYKEVVRDRLVKRLAYVESALDKRDFLLGERFSVADGYLFWCLRTWKYLTKRELTANLQAFYDRVAARPSVKSALAAEV
ncbi:MAG: Glutathione S-transferase domain protein [Myxococcaceae bacterium]|nr:Glutathione S-transferase domain protein [Myxococcaceae bacterium]